MDQLEYSLHNAIPHVIPLEFDFDYGVQADREDSPLSHSDRPTHSLPTKEEFLSNGMRAVEPPCDAESCPICRDDWISGEPGEIREIVALDCDGASHTFHKDCLLLWLTGEDSMGGVSACPMCRRTLFRSEADDLEDYDDDYSDLDVPLADLDDYSDLDVPLADLDETLADLDDLPLVISNAILAAILEPSFKPDASILQSTNTDDLEVFVGMQHADCERQIQTAILARYGIEVELPVVWFWCLSRLLNDCASEMNRECLKWALGWRTLIKDGVCNLWRDQLQIAFLERAGIYSTVELSRRLGTSCPTEVYCAWYRYGRQLCWFQGRLNIAAQEEEAEVPLRVPGLDTHYYEPTLVFVGQDNPTVLLRLPEEGGKDEVLKDVEEIVQADGATFVVHLPLGRKVVIGMSWAPQDSEHAR
jgi:hypothetical protein